MSLGHGLVQQTQVTVHRSVRQDFAAFPAGDGCLADSGQPGKLSLGRAKPFPDGLDFLGGQQPESPT